MANEAFSYVPSAKLNAMVVFRLTDQEKASIEAAARSAGCTVAGYLRRLHHSAGASRTSSAPAFHLPTARHVDSIGPDPLWSGAEALKR